VAWVLAIDVPTGVDADQGEAVDQAVRADVTVTMGLPKKGLLTTAAADYVGRLEVAELGFPAALVDQLAADETRQVIDAGDVRTWLPRRQRDTHKGDFGRVLIVGGARCYPGAVQLAARAALRAGAGLVTVLVPDFLYGVMASGTPEWIVETTPSNPTGSIEGDAARSWRDRLREFDAVLMGPGMTAHADTALWVRQWLRDVQVPLVLDADALNVLAGQAHWLERASGPVVVTPHPGEFARLFGVDQATLQADRAGHARRAADQSGATVLLKGHHSVVAHPDQPAWINLTGNPGMATAGAGDVLAGVVVALLGQGIAPFEAARAAAYLHGRAGDLAADRLGEAGVIASDLIEHLPLAAANLR
jgi:NAD(P)H-hydrate epimerase